MRLLARSGFAKQYVRDDRLLRTEPATNSVYDYGVNKDIENCRSSGTERRRSSTTTTMPSRTSWKPLSTARNCGKWPNRPRFPAESGSQASSWITRDNWRSLVRFANIAAGGSFTTADLYGSALDALGLTESQYSLASFRYDLSKLRAKRLVEKIPRSRRYRLVGKGYSICLVFLKLFERVYAPLTAGLLAPFRGDRILAEEKRCELDRLYRLPLIARNENKILVARHITVKPHVVWN